MHSDPIADFIIRIKNGYMAKKPTVSAPYSKMKAAVATILVDEGFIQSFVQEDKALNVVLRYDERGAAMNDVKRISKPGLRIYVTKKHVPSVLRGRGVAIVSTSTGLMTDKKAREKGVGGELLMKVW